MNSTVKQSIQLATKQQTILYDCILNSIDEETNNVSLISTLADTFRGGTSSQSK